MWHVIAMMRGILIGVAVVGAVGAASAQPRPAVAPLVGATEVVKQTAPAGFIDDVIAADDQRVAYVIADASTRAELHVLTVATSADTVVDLSTITLHPVALHLSGSRVLVVGQNETGDQVAAMFELVAPSTKPAAKPAAKAAPTSKIVYKLGPAKDITVITRDGKPRIAVHRVTPSGDATKHEVEIDSLETGKRVSAGRPLELDAKQSNKKLELTVNHWSDGYTIAHGIKGGEWDKKEDQRTPDVEASYDLVTGKFVAQKKIEDLFDQHKRYQALAEAHDTINFLRVAWDNSAVQIWHNAHPIAVTLDQPITNYDPKSLEGFVAADGSAWFVLKTDPVNPDAVARKKADPEYLDVFRAGPDGKAIRKARVLETGMRVHFGVPGMEPGGHAAASGTADKFWLLERSSGFERGGKTLTLYSVSG